MKCDLCAIEFAEGVKCTTCAKYLDFGCANITEPGWKRLGDERRSKWKCPSCRAPSPGPPSTRDQVTLEAVMKEICDVKIQLIGLPILIEDIKGIKEELKELKSVCQFASDKIDEFTEKITSAEQRIGELEHKYATLEASLSDVKTQLLSSEQRSRLNNVEIKGIPQKKDENLFNIIEKINTKVGYSVPKSSINYISRVPTHNSKEKSIIVSFLNRYIKEDFIAAARAIKTLKAQDIRFQDAPHRIYVNDHLSSDMKLLLNKTREAAKTSNYAYVWVKFGKIHVRKNDNTRTFIVNNVQDLNKVV